MDKRIFGLETEFGCLVRDPSFGPPEHIVEKVKDYAFFQKKIGLIDLHARNYAFEPARAGGFLINGGRLYVDAVGDHEEYATPECSSIFDLVAYDKAGHLILQQILEEQGLAEAVSFHNNSIDHYGGHTFGCHENYLVQLDKNFYLEALSYLLPFLVTRQIFAGVGRVGGHRLNPTDFRRNIMTLSDYEVDYLWVRNFYAVEEDATVNYQLSQRADHILRAISSQVRFNRAIINPRWDSYYDFESFHRLHILFGEANMSEYAMALKVGTTVLVLDLLEIRAIPEEVRLADPVETLKSISRDPTWRWLARRADGKTIRAVDLQRLYLSCAQRLFSGRDFQTDWVLQEWERVLDALERDPRTLSDRLDWVAKLEMLETYMAEEGVSWRADVLKSLDLEYHNVNRKDGLFYALEEMGAVQRLTTDEQIVRATQEPPSDTRASARGRVVRELIQKNLRKYAVDWDGVFITRDLHLPLRNPFRDYHREAQRFLEKL